MPDGHKSMVSDLLSSLLCTSVGLIYNACQLELSVIFILENVSKHQHFKACLHFLASKCSLTQVRPPYESNQPAYLIRIAVASQ